VLATLATTRTESLLAGGDSAASALTGGYHLAFLVGAGLVVAAIGVALAMLRSGVAAEEQVETPPVRAEAAASEAA
jgi:hypothetical protein